MSARIVDRNEDMSVRGRLRLIQQADGDIIVAVQPEENGFIAGGASVEFCSPVAGGGRSPRTLAALRALMDAMEQDNAGRPQVAAPAQEALTDAEIERLALANGFKHKQQPDGTLALNPYVFDFARAVRGQVSDAADAARYRFLRDQMCFTTEPKQVPTMAWGGAPAPEHDPHRDWMGDRFTASVDRTVDAAMQAQAGDAQSGEVDHG